MDLITLKKPEQVFFFSAPAASSEFAPEDPLALDYLAQQVGLWLLPTVTTRSSRAQSYAMVLVGLQLAEEARERYVLPADDEERRKLFERWERFWALATFEFRNGELRRGDVDAMRGIRGAARAWTGGDKPLPLNFMMISRQQELGSLGAYLSPLRLSHLVVSGSLRLTSRGEEVARAFWGEAGELTSRYQEYALAAMDPSCDRVARKLGNLTLKKVGERSRLSSLNALHREAQQARLADYLLDSEPHTNAIASLIKASAEESVLDTRGILDGAIEARWGEVDASLCELLVLARKFGEVMHVVLRLFDRVYAALAAAGWRASRSVIAEKALTGAQLDELQNAVRACLDAPQVTRFRSLATHGNAFVRFLENIRDASPSETVRVLLAHHRQVQKERLRVEPWVLDEDGQLTLLLTTYTTRADEVERFPNLKFNVVRQLLRDVGRLPSGQTNEGEEAS
jgi:hypothetical protein